MKTILVPVDFSDATPRVIEAASQMAKAFASRVVLLHVAEPEPDFVGFEPGPATVRMSVARDFRAEHQQMDELKNSFLAVGIESTALHVQGSSVEKILHEAMQHDAGLIVIGSHGHGALYELLAGSVTAGVLKDSKCPVLVVPVAPVRR